MWQRETLDTKCDRACFPVLCSPFTILAPLMEVDFVDPPFDQPATLPCNNQSLRLKIICFLLSSYIEIAFIC